MMDTTNSFANNGIPASKTSITFKLNGTAKNGNGLRKSRKGTMETDESSSSSESANNSSSSPSRKKSSKSPQQLNGQVTRIKPQQSRRSSLKSSSHASPAGPNLPDAEEYGDIMKDYCYNENNVLVPRYKLDGTSIKIQGDNDDLRKGGSGHCGEMGQSEHSITTSPSRRPPKRSENLSFWDQDSSESESETIRQSSPNHQSTLSMVSMRKTASARRVSAPTLEFRRSDSSGDEYFTAQEQPSAPERRGVGRKDSDWFTGASFSDDEGDSMQKKDPKEQNEPPPPDQRGVARNDSGWFTGGSFSDDEEFFEKKTPKANLNKLSQAALRMSQSGPPTFSFTKKNAKMDNYALNTKAELKDTEVDEIDENDSVGEGEDSAHSSASKTSTSFVSTGGWSTGKESSSSEEDNKRKRLHVAAIKKRKSNTDDKSRTEEVKNKAEHIQKSQDSSRRSKLIANASGQSTDSKFSFISANSGSIDSSSTCSDEIRRASIGETEDGKNAAKVLFDFSAIGINSLGNGKSGEAISKGDEVKTKKIRSTVDIKTTEDKSTAEGNMRCSSSKKTEKDKDPSTEDKKEGSRKKGSDKCVQESKQITKKEKSIASSKKKEKDKLEKNDDGTAKEKSKKKKDKDAPDKKLRSKKKSYEAENTSRKEPKEEKPNRSSLKESSKETSIDEKYLEKRRQERAVRLEKAKERIKQEKSDKKEADEADEKAKAAELKRRESEPLTEDQRRQRAYMWYTRCGMPTKDNLKRRIPSIQSCDITEDDIDLLPWMTGDRMVNVAKMMKITREK